MLNRQHYTVIKALLIPLGYAILLRLFFGVDTWGELFSVMSKSFLFCVPTIVGALTVYFSSDERANGFWYPVLAPWIPIFFFLFITMVLSLEGWACWLMVLPIFLIAASVGGLIGAWLKRRKKRKEMYMSVLVLLPLFLSPIEQLVGAIPGTYEAATYIDIQASPANIWSNVTRVRTIDAAQDKGYLTRWLGFPRPLNAELNYEGVGAHREARFTNGLVFNEKVLSYQHQQKMTFSIDADPTAIPSTTLDEHVVIGGKYFDVLNGTYELEKRNDSVYRLHLYSHFQLKTTFNFYASWWARMIMKDIQNNILQVEKIRSENKAR